LDKYNPDQFEIVGILNHGCDSEYDLAKPILNGKEKFSRILIRRRQQKETNDGGVGANNYSPLQTAQPKPYHRPDTTLPLAAEDPETYNQNR